MKFRRYSYGAGAAVVLAVLLFAALAGRERSVPVEFQQQAAGDVAGYMRDCVDGVLQGGVVPDACRSAESAKQAYDVDVWFLLKAAHARAIDTAQRIVGGQILKEKDYRACVKEGDCSELPLPRSGKSQAQQEAILQFLQSLADGRRVDPQVCAFLDICRALVKAGLYDPAVKEE